MIERLLSQGKNFFHTLQKTHIFLRQLLDALFLQHQYVSVVMLALACAGLGMILAHMDVSAQAVPAPFSYSGNAVRMKITASRVTGESPKQPFSDEETDATVSRLLMQQLGVKREISYSPFATQGIYLEEQQAKMPHGLVDFSEGKIIIITENGFTPISLASISSSTLDYTAIHDKEDVSITSKYLSSLFTHNDSLYSSSSAQHSDSTLFFQCSIKPEARRKPNTLLPILFKFGSSVNEPNARHLKYVSTVKQYALKYNLPPELILGIMQTESNFNPFATSQSQALGLMQIVPETAGGEVYSYLTGKKGTPSAELLFQPEYNIRYGAVYLHLLNTRYFQGVKSEASRKLLTIAAYNGGPGAVIRVFDKDQDIAIEVVNSMTTAQVYKELTEKMPRLESRLYVDKVLSNIQSFIDT